MTDVVEKVRKLIALAASDSKEEARTAAMLACRLIRENNLVVSGGLVNGGQQEPAQRVYQGNSNPLDPDFLADLYRYAAAGAAGARDDRARAAQAQNQTPPRWWEDLYSGTFSNVNARGPKWEPFRREPPKPPDPWVGWPPCSPLPANARGHCHRCGERIEPGWPTCTAQKFDDSTARMFHADCYPNRHG